MVPEQVVGPAPLVARRADVRVAVGEEAAVHELHALGPAAQALPERDQIRADAQRMDDAELQARLVRQVDHALGLGEAHRERDLDQDVLAVLEREPREARRAARSGWPGR